MLSSLLLCSAMTTYSVYRCVHVLCLLMCSDRAEGWVDC